MVIWIIGMSGSGKTTLSNLICEKLRPQIPNLVRLDGDVLRDVFSNDVGYTIKGRRKNAERLSKLTKMLALQELHVVAAVLSIFPEWQTWNRQNIKDYREIYLKTSLFTLQKRDTKGLYSSALRGDIKNVVGVDIDFPEPSAPDIVFENDEERDDLNCFLDELMELDVIKRAISET